MCEHLHGLYEGINSGCLHNLVRPLLWSFKHASHWHSISLGRLTTRMVPSQYVTSVLTRNIFISAVLTSLLLKSELRSIL